MDQYEAKNCKDGQVIDSKHRCRFVLIARCVLGEILYARSFGLCGASNSTGSTDNVTVLPLVSMIRLRFESNPFEDIL